MRAKDVLGVLGVLRGLGSMSGRGRVVQASPEANRLFEYPARCFVTGWIGGSAVPCLSAEQQVYFHQGYEPKDRDLHDMAQLREAFGLDPRD